PRILSRSLTRASARNRAWRGRRSGRLARGISMSTLDTLRTIVSEVARREHPRTEATLQAQVRQLLLTAPLDLDADHVVELEAQVGDGRRIDVEVGFTVIEVKKDLRKGRVRENAVEQLAGYVQHRTKSL